MTPEQMARVREIVACAREHHALRDTYVIDPLDIDVLSALLAAVERMQDTLTRLSQWDMMDSSADGPYWRSEIARALTEPMP